MQNAKEKCCDNRMASRSESQRSCSVGTEKYNRFHYLERKVFDRPEAYQLRKESFGDWTQTIWHTCSSVRWLTSSKDLVQIALGLL